MKRIGVLASGRGSNLGAILEATRSGILRDLCKIHVVASDREGSGALDLARAQGVPARALPVAGRPRRVWDQALVELLEPYALDYLVLAGFMRILSEVVILRYPGRIVNIHPADTRLHQGLHGYAWAFEQRLPSTKVTVHLVDAGLDTGPVLLQREVDLRGADSLAEVERRGLAVEHAAYSEALRDLLTGQGAPSPPTKAG